MKQKWKILLFYQKYVLLGKNTFKHCSRITVAYGKPFYYLLGNVDVFFIYETSYIVYKISNIYQISYILCKITYIIY